MQFEKVSVFTYPFGINYTGFCIELHRLQTCTLLSFNSGEKKTQMKKHTLIIAAFCMKYLISVLPRPSAAYYTESKHLKQISYIKTERSLPQPGRSFLANAGLGLRSLGCPTPAEQHCLSTDMGVWEEHAGDRFTLSDLSCSKIRQHLEFYAQRNETRTCPYSPWLIWTLL